MMWRTDSRNLIFLFEISEKEKRTHEDIKKTLLN